MDHSQLRSTHSDQRTVARHQQDVGPWSGSTLGRLEVPRLGLSTIVIEGDDEYSLLVGAGHLPETPLPWNDGNSVLAGHRDTDFRPLRNIQVGDTIRFHTADIAVDYTVRETEIVEPTDVTALKATDVPTLTLITCYPFSYIGPAPNASSSGPSAQPGHYALRAVRRVPDDTRHTGWRCHAAVTRNSA